jgi:hypothetical protein
LVGFYNELVASRAEDLKGGSPFNPKKRRKKSMGYDNAAAISKISLDEIKDGIGPLVAENVAYWIDSVNAIHLFDKGDPSVALRQMRESLDSRQKMQAIIQEDRSTFRGQ